MDQSFDIAALKYDQEFTHSLTGTLQREQVWKYLDQQIASKKPLHILELNCGTGEDALHMAKKGHVVTATDLSEEMLNQAKAKINKNALGHKVHFRQLDLRQMAPSDWDRQYDMVFSNFGGVNCLDANDMKNLGKQVQRVLKPGGRFVLVVMSRFCIWESLYFLLKGKGREVLRRKKEFVLANVSGVDIKTWYYSSRGIKRLLKPDFSAIKTKPIGLFGPPSYLEFAMRRHKGFFKSLNWLEKLAARFSWQSNCADHFYIELEVTKA